MESFTQVIVFGGGCFWCTEAVFAELRGVLSVMPGYAGGDSPSPSYEAVCSGSTGHAEVIRVEFDPAVISLDDLLTVFFATHDPTTLNRQGNDVGTQYRSIVLTTSDEQKREVEAFIKKLDADDPNTRPVVTEVKPLETFYEAEEYHREYYKKNQNAGYCQFVINPKIKKLKEKFGKILKESEH